MTLLTSEATLRKKTLKNKHGLRFDLLENGSIFMSSHDGIMIHQYRGNPAEGSVGNIYLRCFKDGKISYAPLTGPNSTSTFRVTGKRAVWQGRFGDLEYACCLQLAEKDFMWFWTVYLRNHGQAKIDADLVCAQDLGLAVRLLVSRNEAYISHYIDHHALNHKKYGFLLCSRQGYKQLERNPWLMHGCLSGSRGYLADGFQFYGLDYKETNIPGALLKPELPNSVLQYEFALPTLLSRKMKLAAASETAVTFFAVYDPDHSPASGRQDLPLAEKAAAVAAREVPDNFQWNTRGGSAVLPALFNRVSMFQSRNLTASEIASYFPGAKRNIEKKDSQLLSFYYGDHAHVALRAKELLQERPQGMIYRSGHDTKMTDDILTTTVYGYGVFNSQLAIGSSEFNKLISVSRNHLNVVKSCGQRIFVETDNGYVLLGLASAVEMGLNYTRWIYAGRGETIVVTNMMDSNNPASFVDIQVKTGKARRFLITSNIVMGRHEWENQAQLTIDAKAKTARLWPVRGSIMWEKYPQTNYYIVSPHSDTIDHLGADELLYPDRKRRGHPFVTISTHPARHFTLAVTGSVLDSKRAAALARRYRKSVSSVEKLKRGFAEHLARVSNHASLRLPSNPALTDSLNDIMYWYMHTAAVGYLSPRGLEQNTSAQWGVRDVLQGACEWLKATRQYAAERNVLQLMFKNQVWELGLWPQCLRFDRYRMPGDEDTHNDTTIWPMKTVCDYIIASGDIGILYEKVPYWSDRTLRYTSKTETILSHVRRELDCMKAEFFPGTALIRFGHGDWEDTMQPANQELREQMVSSWTVELMYQTLRSLEIVCEKAGETKLLNEVRELLPRIRQDFKRYLVKDGVVAGLVLFHSLKKIEYLLHPRDRRYGIHYRLLPMTRGMTSGMLTPEEAARHYGIIKKHLCFPDGVRLTEKPIRYTGGTQHYFKRAETSALFGREVGMMYTHAHLRFVEAMAFIGKAGDALHGLRLANPVGVTGLAPLSNVRQSNVYYTSSDADFADRYLAQDHFSWIKAGKVGYKGGWRFHSSGPGVFTNILISSILGLRTQFDDIIIDPVLPRSLDGLVFDYDYKKRKVRYHYHVKTREYSPRSVSINGVPVKTMKRLDHPYREGGIFMPKRDFVRLLNRRQNTIDIYM